MKAQSESTRWAARYRRALRGCLEDGSGADLQSALGLGRQAVRLGLGTLDVAKFHEKALKALALPGGETKAGRRMTGRATAFFAETVIPIEGTHRAAVEDEARVKQLTRTLRQRTAETSASTRLWKRSIVQRKAAEVSLKESAKRRAKLVTESQRLQTHLRLLTHACLSAQENGRKSVSRELQDEIAQTLVAISVRLLALKEAAKANTENLKKEIAETRELVKQSSTIVIRLAHECSIQKKT